MEEQVQEKCPICGASNERYTVTDCHMTVEDYYLCKECSYFELMAYSKPICGIRIEQALKYLKEIDKYGDDIQILNNEEYAHYMSAF